MPQRATLRPVPHRPSGPVEPAEALAYVERHLPGLDQAAREALALVELAGRTRPQIRAESGVAPEELSAALARARKALRRASSPLPGSGWCERAERLLSDELDGELADSGPRRLATHMANCDRCVEHERRLWQARDHLVAAFEEERAPAPAPAPVQLERPDTEAPELPEPDRPMIEPPAPAAALEAAPPPELKLVQAPAEAPPAAETPMPGIPEPVDPLPEEPPPAAAQAAVAEQTVAGALPDPGRASLTGLAWTALMALAVLLAIASIALTAWAIAGGGL